MKKITNKVLSALLTLTMVISMVPGFTMTANAAEPDGTALSTELGTVALTSGTYYLAGNTTGKITVNEGEDVTLDLNGYMLIGSGDCVIVNYGTLTITDSNPDEEHYFSYVSDGAWEYIAEPTPKQTFDAVTIDAAKNAASIVKVCGGCITGGDADKGGGIFTNAGTTLSVTGGNIVGNKATQGGGIYTGNAVNITLKDTAIIGNYATGSFGGVLYNADNATSNCTIGGTVKIFENLLNSEKSNLTVWTSGDSASLIPDNLNEDSKIYIALTYSAGQKAGSITSASDADYSECFASDNASYNVCSSGSGETQQVVLTDHVACVVSDDNTTSYSTLQGAIDAAQTGDTVKMLSDITLNSQANGFININKSITLDGNNHTINGYALRNGNAVSIEINQINPSDEIDVVIKNLTVANSAYGARPVETRATDDTRINSLTFDNVTITTGGGGEEQGLTIGNSHTDKPEIIIKNSSISAVYSILGFNPAIITIDNSTITGWSCVFLREPYSSEGSYGTELTIKNGSVLTGTNTAGGSTDNFATIVTEGDVIISVEDSTIIANAINTPSQHIFRIEDTGVFYGEAEHDTATQVTISGDSTLIANGSESGLIYFDVWNSLTGDGVNKQTIKFEDGSYLGSLYCANATGEELAAEELQLTGGIYSEEPLDKYIAEGYTKIANPDQNTNTTYPYKVVPVVTVSGVSMSQESFAYGDTVSYTGTPVATASTGIVSVSDWTYTYYKKSMQLVGKKMETTWTELSSAPTDVGNYKLVVEANDGACSGSQTITFSIAKKALTITADDKTSVVGATQPALTYTVSGLVGTDTLTAEPALSCSPDMNTAGEYDITVSGGTATDNYTISTYTSGKLTVIKASQNAPAKGEGYSISGTTLTAENGYELYDGTNIANTFNITEGTSYFIRKSEIANQKFASAYTEIDTSISVSALATPTDMGTVKITGVTDGKCQIGSSVTVTATPKNGYEFVEWRDAAGNKIADAEATYQFTATVSNTLTAVFKEKNKVVATLPTVISAEDSIYTGNTIVGVSGGIGCTLSGITSAIEVGTYSATATLEEGYDVWPDGTSGVKTLTWSILPQNQDSPYNIVANGMVISPVTDEMEYKLSSDDEYTSVPESATSITVTEEGTYYIRMKATDNSAASKIAVVIVENPTINVVTLQPANLTTNGAIFTGYVENFDIDRVKAEWFQLYCKDDSSNIQWLVNNGKIGTNAVATSFQDTVSSLTPDTEYEIRAYVKLYDNTFVYGPYITFRTPKTDDTVVTLGTIQASATMEGAATKKVIISVEEGNDVIASAMSESVVSAGSTFTATFNNLPDGNYNVVVRTEDGVFTETRRVTIENGSTVNAVFTIPLGQLATIVKVKTPETPKIAVEGLANILTVADKNAAAIGTENVEIKLEAEKEETTASEAQVDTTAYAVAQIKKLIPEPTATLEEKIETVLDLNLIKTTTELENNVVKSVEIKNIGAENDTVLEVAVPYEVNGKTLNVYRYHNNLAEKLTALNSRPSANYIDGTYYIGKDCVYIYASGFSTYVISYEETKSSGSDDSYVYGGGGSTATTYTVTCSDTANGTISVDRKNASANQTITITVSPKSGYILTALTAKDANDNNIDLTVVTAGNKYTFKMPETNVTISATFIKEGTCPQDETCVYAKFIDADTKAWYHDGVHYCVEHKYMNGIASNLFAPNDTLSRAMIVTILWNMEGHPVANYVMTFKDVPDNLWYTEAIRWAQSTGVVTGYDENSFGPEDNVTREQLAAILYRYSKYKGYNVQNATDLEAYDDKKLISKWAMESVKWANAEGIIMGRTNATIVPQGDTTRAEAACMVQRFCEGITK